MLSEIDFKIVYSTGDNEPVDFFLDALLNSTEFDLGLGFFHSSGLRTLALGFAYFIYKGGKMRMIMNDTLSIEDKEAIEKGLILKPEQLIETRFIESLNAILNTLSSYEKHFFNCLSWLIASKKLEILIITPKAGGIAHQKFGVFRDKDSNKVAFNGSANFSKSALKHNLETINCFCSWTGERSSIEAIEYFENLFDKLWNGKSNNIIYVPVHRVKTFIREKFPINDIKDLLDEEEELNLGSLKYKSDTKHIDLKNKLHELNIKYIPDNFPHIPNNIKLFDYQVEAFIKWKENNFHGLFEMATGTGKTITALNCALRMFDTEKRLFLIILVPTLDLSTQWEGELNSFGFTNLLIANSTNSDWYTLALQQVNQFNKIPSNVIIITTYSSFLTDKFQSILGKIPPKTILIADEAHNFGAERMINNFPYKIERRIGLSATPARYFDEYGTDKLVEYFGATDGPTFKLDMREAIERGFLSQYYYYPHIVKLTVDEMEKYKDISSRLMQYFDSRAGRFQDNTVTSSLLMQRKRIIHKAENKAQCFREILSKLIKQNPNLKYTLVYVPEGRPDHYDNDDERLINEYSEILVNDFKLKQHQFTGKTNNREKVLASFADGTIDVLTAMKCLDEGVDIRRTEVAIFCASTGNPRQFIQRRGRILRKHPDKKFAYIYDIIVVPLINDNILTHSINMERNILINELKRVKEFANLAINKYDALSMLESICEEFNIDIFSD